METDGSMETVGRLARRFGLSRSTLLYYDRIGLLSPSGRSAAGYRLYSEEDAERLAAIVRYRESGLPLDAVGEMLEAAPESSTASTPVRALEARLAAIHDEMAALRHQQRVVIRLLRAGGAELRERPLDKAGWTALLRASGLDDDDMWRWHAEFERMAPEVHKEFLATLGIGEEEIESIRKRSGRR
jgi:MerR family transcriptional regulator, thiopeptide resistance regulator